MKRDTAWAVGLSALVLVSVAAGLWIASVPTESRTDTRPGADEENRSTPRDDGASHHGTTAPSRTNAARGTIREPSRSPGQRSVERERRPAADEILRRITAWDAATGKERALAARHVLRQVEHLSLSGLETFEFDGRRHELPVYVETRTELAFVLIPAGSFIMGVPKSDAWASDADTAHVVTLTRPFLISRTEVTVDAWNRIMSDAVRAERGDLPVVGVSWNTATAFCARAKMRLPTEAEWEYASRAGTQSRFYSGDSEDDLARIAWCKQNSGGRRHGVAKRPANAFGLHDTHGNVLEWCRDGFAPFDEEHATDPTGDPGALLRVIRGGSFEHSGQSSTAGNRHRQGPQGTWHHVGFRPVIELP